MKVGENSKSDSGSEPAGPGSCVLRLAHGGNAYSSPRQHIWYIINKKIINATTANKASNNLKCTLKQWVQSLNTYFSHGFGSKIINVTLKYDDTY